LGMTLSERRMDLGQMNPLMQNELDTIEEAKEQLTLDSPESACRALRKIQVLKKKAAEIERIADAEINRINEWRAEELRKLNDNIAWFEALLYAYHHLELERDPNRKTIKLPYGTLQIRAQQPVFHRDEETLFNWVAKNKPKYLVPQDPKLDWAGLKSTLKVAGNVLIDPETGEQVPGVTVEERPPKFSVKVEEE